MKHDSTVGIALLCLALSACDEAKPDQTTSASTTLGAASASLDGKVAEAPTAETTEIADQPTSGWSIDFEGDLADLKGDDVLFESQKRQYLLRGAPALVQFDLGGPIDAGTTGADVQTVRMTLTRSRRNCIYEPGGNNLKFNLKVTPRGDSLLAEFDGQLRCAPLGPQATAELTKVAGSFVVGP